MDLADEQSGPEDELPVGGADLVTPLVLAVVVAKDPGDWFEDCLASLAAQDYRGLAVVVVDNASAAPLEERVAAVLPGAVVQRRSADVGYGAAVNSVLGDVGGAPYLLLCHDDVRLDPDVVTILTDEALRSNAGIVGPKLVDWDDRTRIRQVGFSADKTGVPAPFAEPGELDQEQHDGVRDVFGVPSGCLLVRSDLLVALGGFDEGIDFLGDDVDLCWRADVAGARVLIVPDAVVAHREALGARRPVDDRRRLAARHRLRSMLVAYRLPHRLRVVPWAVLFALVEIAGSLVTGRFRQAREVAAAWTWNARRYGDIRRRRRGLRRVRGAPDHEVRRLMVHGSARVNAFLRGQIGHDPRVSELRTASAGLAQSMRTGRLRAAVVAGLVVTFVTLVGSRHLLTRGVPPLGEFPLLSGDASWRAWWEGRPTVGLGSAGWPPDAFAVLWLPSLVLSDGMLRTLAIVGLLPIGAVGMWRFVSPIGSRQVAAAAVLTFVACPLPYAALAEARWSALGVYAASPWLLGRLARASGDAPWTGGVSVRRRVLGLGLLVAIVTAFVPFAVAIVAGGAIAYAVGGILALQPRGGLRWLGFGIAALVVAFVLHLPWSLELTSGQWVPFAGSRQDLVGGVSLAELLRFRTGPIDGGALGWALLVPAVLALFVAREWRFAWAVRGWTLAIGGWGAAWVAARGDLPVPLPPAELLLAPAAVGVALAVAMAVAAFETDVPEFRFGWRQLAVGVGIASIGLALLPVFGSAMNGRWHLPEQGFDELLVFVDRGDETSQVLWLGAPDVLPLTAWPLRGDLSFAVGDGLPRLREEWPGPERGRARVVRHAVGAALDGDTSRLGRDLAPSGVRYIVVATSIAPAGYGAEVLPLPQALTDALAGQLDLEPIQVDDALVVYRNAAWSPGKPEAASTPDGAGAAHGAQAAAWLLSVVALLRWRDRERRAARATPDTPDGAATIEAPSAAEVTQ